MITLDPILRLTGRFGAAYMNELTHTTNRLVVEVEGPSGRRTVSLPAGARIDDLLPGLVELLEGRADSAGWGLAPTGEGRLAGTSTLGESGLYAGAVLVLIEPADRPEPAPESPGWAARVPAIAQRIRTSLRPPAQPKGIDRLSKAEYLRLLEAAIAAPPVQASVVVAVTSADPGAGTTTVTTLLATLLSRLRGEDVVAVDGNPESGALSHWLVPDSRVSGEAYRSLFKSAPTPEQVRAALVSAGPGLSLLPVLTDQSGKHSADASDWSRVIEHLRHLHHTVLVDCAAGFQRPATRAALESADQVVLVSKPRAGGLDRLAPAVESLRRQGRTIVVVANQAHRRARSTHSALGFQVVTIEFEARSAARLKTRGFAWSEAPASWQESVRELAAVLVGSRGAPIG